MLFLTLFLACGEKDGESADTVGDCEVLSDRTCGNATPEGEDSACPEGYSCWGPSAFQCYRGEDCNLPICLDAETRIATPDGPVPVVDLREGDRVLSLDEAGRVTTVPVLLLGSTAAPPGHRMVRVDLSDGRSFRASPGHPVASGVPIDELRVGEALEGARITAIEWTDYGAHRTHDLLPAGPTGTYRADGVWLGSTLADR